MDPTITLSEADVVMAGTDSYDAYTIEPDGGIQIPWAGIILTHHIRVAISFSYGSSQFYLCELRRNTDKSYVIAPIPISRTLNNGYNTVTFLTYTNSADDPFVKDGFYVSINNISDANVRLAAGSTINVLIVTEYAQGRLF
jgi:hypothetical protein